jgi:uncharacterized protein
MRYLIPLVLSLAACLPASGRAQGMPMEHRQPVPQIVTSGMGEARMTPDRARIHVAVETRATTAAAAAAENARIQQVVMQRLRALGIPDNRLGTAGYNVNPEYQHDREGNRPRVIGYVARNTILAELHDLQQVGPVIDGAIAAGANSIGGLNFYSSRTEEARRSALAEAVRAARADAEAMAVAAGGRLGMLLELSSGGGFSPPPFPPMARMEAAQGMAMDTPINPGEQTMTMHVTARWQFLGAGGQ